MSIGSQFHDVMSWRPTTPTCCIAQAIFTRNLSPLAYDTTVCLRASTTAYQTHALLTRVHYYSVGVLHWPECKLCVPSSMVVVLVRLVSYHIHNKLQSWLHQHTWHLKLCDAVKLVMRMTITTDPRPDTIACFEPLIVRLCDRYGHRPLGQQLTLS